MFVSELSAFCILIFFGCESKNRKNKRLCACISIICHVTNIWYCISWMKNCILWTTSASEYATQNSIALACVFVSKLKGPQQTQNAPTISNQSKGSYCYSFIWKSHTQLEKERFESANLVHTKLLPMSLHSLSFYSHAPVCLQTFLNGTHCIVDLQIGITAYLFNGARSNIHHIRLWDMIHHTLWIIRIHNH